MADDPAGEWTQAEGIELPEGDGQALVRIWVVVPGDADGTMYAGGDPGVLFESRDSGATWSPINDGLGDLLDNHASFNALVLDPDHTDVLYVATSGYGVFRSSDGGATWAPFNDGLTYLDVRLLTVARGTFTSIYAGTPGGVFKIVDDGR